jgi:hypothetical protein
MRHAGHLHAAAHHGSVLLDRAVEDGLRRHSLSIASLRMRRPMLLCAFSEALLGRWLLLHSSRLLPMRI